jgi:hypothetical protein
LGYHEALRGLGGIVAPLLAGFSLAAIATITTSDHAPPLADWAVAAFAAVVAFLLFSMQVAFLSLGQVASPDDVLAWRPEARVSETELQEARRVQGLEFEEMSRLGRLSFYAYAAGLIAFLLGVLLLMVPDDWSAARITGFAIIGAALLLEIWWEVANDWPRLPHPVSRTVPKSDTHAAGWEGNEAPPLDLIGRRAVLGSESGFDGGSAPTAVEGNPDPLAIQPDTEEHSSEQK